MTSLADYNRVASQIGIQPDFRAVVLSVHGVNTTGPWQKRIAPILAEKAFLCVPVDYGFQRLKLLRPKKLLRKAVEATWSDYEKYFDKNLPFSVIGHSFGTLAIASLIQDRRDAKFDNVILAGSILKIDFPWAKHIGSSQVGRILNEISRDDTVVKLCPTLKVLSPRLPVGKSGCRGFTDTHENIYQRSHSVGHCGVLSDVVCKSAWVPFLRGESIQIS